MPDTDANTRTAPSPPTGDDPLTVPARIRVQVPHTPAWTRMLSPVQTFIAFLPSHKSTRAGRQAARQIKLVAFAAAGALMIFGGELASIVLGALLMLISLVIPMPEGRKRSIQSRLKTLRSARERTVERAGSLVHDGRRLILQKEGAKLRRVLVDRGERIVPGRMDGTAALKLEPSSGRKADSIWVACREVDPGELGETLEEWDEKDVDHPAFVDEEGFRRLRQLLDR